MTVVLDDRGAVRIIRIDRAERANALDAATNAALGQALLDAESDPSVRAVVLTGTGDRSFCAGMDLKAFASGGFATGPRLPGVEQLTERFYRKPVVAAVNGAAVGGGFGIVLGCDLVVAAVHATFGIPEVRHGLVGVGVTSRAALRLPPALVLQLALTADPIDAETAQRFGIVNLVVPAGEVLAAAVGLATRIAEHSPPAVLAAKDIAYAAAQLFDAVDLAALRARAEHVTSSPEARAGAHAFVENRAKDPRG